MLRPFVARLRWLIPLLVVTILCWAWSGRAQAVACTRACPALAWHNHPVASVQLQATTPITPGAHSAITPMVVTPATPPATATPASPQSGAAVNIPQQRRVKVNFFINSISNVNDQAGAYDIDFYLDFYWHEPALEGKTLDMVDKATLWDPRLEVVNSKNITTLARTYLNSLEPDTNVRLSYRLSGTFMNPFDLHKFPFDQQVFSIKLESSDYDSSQLLFDFIGIDKPIVYSDQPFEQPLPKGKYIAADFALDEWRIDDAKVIEQIHVLTYDKSSWAQLRVDILATRNSLGYFWKIVLELGFLLLLVWGVFFLESQDLRYRLLLLLTLLLATVLFSFMMLQILSRLSYLTFVDLYLLLCYSAIGVVTVVVSLVKLLYETKRAELAAKLNRFALLLYPIFWVGANLLLFWYVSR